MSINFTKFVISGSLASVALLAIASQASAFTFTTNFEGAGGKGDVFLKSVTLENGEVVDNFSLITGATIVNNDAYSGGNTGAASVDRGDEATTGIVKEDPTAEEIVFNLGNTNLNNIVDTEDIGNFQIDLDFSSAWNNLLIWERGMNSDLGVQALDAEGNLIGKYLKVDRDDWAYAGFEINTTEIDDSQKVGSYGINLADDLGVSGPVASIRFFSESSFNGPDWKFVGTAAAEDVPESSLALGMLLLGSFVLRKRKLANG